VQGRCGWLWSGIVAVRRQWIDEHKINVLVQFGLDKHPDLPNVPSVLDYAKTDEQKQILRLVLVRQPLGRPFFAPPGIPADRAEALCKAFMATMADPRFLAAAQKAKLEINTLSGADVAAVVNGGFTSASPTAVAKTKDILSRAMDQSPPRAKGPGLARLCDHGPSSAGQISKSGQKWLRKKSSYL